jgi:hypothetical protein
MLQARKHFKYACEFSLHENNRLMEVSDGGIFRCLIKMLGTPTSLFHLFHATVLSLHCIFNASL